MLFWGKEKESELSYFAIHHWCHQKTRGIHRQYYKETKAADWAAGHGALLSPEGQVLPCSSMCVDQSNYLDQLATWLRVAGQTGRSLHWLLLNFTKRLCSASVSISVQLNKNSFQYGPCLLWCSCWWGRVLKSLMSIKGHELINSHWFLIQT